MNRQISTKILKNYFIENKPQLVLMPHKMCFYMTMDVKTELGVHHLLCTGQALLFPVFVTFLNSVP